MPSLGPATKIYLARRAHDPAERDKSFDGLYARVFGVLEADPLNGRVFVFRNRRRDRIKYSASTAAGCGSAPSGWTERGGTEMAQPGTK